MSYKRNQQDPIDILKDYITNNRKIRQKDNYLYFDQNKFKLDTETCILSTKTKKQYNLGSLWLFLNLESKGETSNIRNYHEKSKQLKLDPVQKLDQKTIKDYFSGQIEDTDFINLDLKQKLLNNNISFFEPDLQKKRKINEQGEAVQLPPVQMTKEQEQYKNLRYIHESEKALTTKTRKLRDSHKDFSQLLQHLRVFTQQSSQISQIPSAIRELPNCKLKQLLDQKKKPIIVVPMDLTDGNICLKNFDQLFNKGEYIKPSQAQKNISQGKLEIRRPIKGINIKFEVVDRVHEIQSRNQWDCIVAVFLNGSQYQVSRWQGGNDIGRLFEKVRAYFLHYDNVKPSQFVKQSNYQSLDLHTQNRTQDKVVRNRFWDDLESFMLRPLN